jgi:hypothetical protein
MRYEFWDSSALATPRANWLCSVIFLLSRALLRLAFHWPLATGHNSHAPRSTSGVRSCADPPGWLPPSTDRRIEKDRTGPDLDERSVHIQYVTEIQYVTKPGNFFGLVHPFLPAARWLTTRSWPQPLNAKGSGRAGRKTSRCDTCPLTIPIPKWSVSQITSRLLRTFCRRR